MVKATRVRKIIVFGTISFVWISLHFNNIQNALLFVSLHHKVISKLTLFNQTRIFNIKILELRAILTQFAFVYNFLS